MILTKTPLRVSLFGGGSDYVEHSQQHGGAVLGMAINKFVYVGVKHMPPGQLMRMYGVTPHGKEQFQDIPIRYRVQYSKVDDCASRDEVKHPAVRAALAYFNIDTPLEFHTFGDLPGRSGLGGSSAFSVGLLSALTRLLGFQVHDTAESLAAEAVAFEQHIVQETVGVQDQIFAAVGGINYIQFGEYGAEIKKLDLAQARVRELEESLLLVYSGTMRDAHVMAKKQIAELPNKTDVLKQMSNQAEEAMLLLSNPHASLHRIGPMLYRAWYMKKSITPEISSPEIDALYERGLSLGATGGKLLGAGGGGFMLFYVPKEKQVAFSQDIHAPTVAFKVSHAGSEVLVDEAA